MNARGNRGAYRSPYANRAAAAQPQAGQTYSFRGEQRFGRRDGSPTTSFPSPRTGDQVIDQRHKQYDTEYNRFFAKEEDFERKTQGQYTSSGTRIAGTIWG